MRFHLSKDKHAKKGAFPVKRTVFLSLVVCLAAISLVAALSIKHGEEALMTAGEAPRYAGAAATNATSSATSSTGSAAAQTADTMAITTSSSAGTTTTAKPTQPATTAKPASPTLLQETAKAGDDYLEGTIFVGDSRVNGMVGAKVLPRANAFAYNGLCHANADTKKFVDLGDGKIRTIPEALGVRKPERVVVEFGINGIAWIGEKSFIASYEELLDAMVKQSPDTTYIIQSILPVSAAKESSDSRYANEKIDRYNALLLELAEKKGMYYLNAAEALKNSSGSLDSRFDSGDGLHFSSAASQELLDYFLTHTI